MKKEALTGNKQGYDPVFIAFISTRSF